MFTDIKGLVVRVNGVVTNIVYGGEQISFDATIANISAYTIWIRCEIRLSSPTTTVYVGNNVEYTPGQQKVIPGNFTYVFSKDMTMTAVTYYRYLGVEYGPEDSYSVSLDYMTPSFSNIVITSFAKA